VKTEDNNYWKKYRIIKDKKQVYMIRLITSVNLIILILVVGVITCGETGGG
jgi:hypothetical protein